MTCLNMFARRVLWYGVKSIHIPDMSGIVPTELVGMKKTKKNGNLLTSATGCHEGAVERQSGRSFCYQRMVPCQSDAKFAVDNAHRLVMKAKSRD